MSIHRTKSALLALAGIISAAAGNSVLAGDRTEVRMLASPAQAGPYNAFSTIQTHIDEFSDKLTFDVEETQGANFHVKYMLRHPEETNTVFWTGTVVNWAAASGMKPYFPGPQKKAEDFRIITVMGRTYNVWVTMDQGIRTPKDFVGKRVGNGLLSQNEWGMHQHMLVSGWGLLDKVSSLDILGPGQNINALLDGREDVGTLFGLISADGEHVVVTGPHRKLEATTRPWHYVNVPLKMIRDYVDDTGAPFQVVKLDPDTLPNQPKTLTTFGDLLVIAAYKSFPDEAAYELARMLVEHYDEIGEYSAFTRAWTPETLAFTAEEHPENFHPGALEAYRDLGVIGD